MNACALGAERKADRGMAARWRRGGGLSSRLGIAVAGTATGSAGCSDAMRHGRSPFDAALRMRGCRDRGGEGRETMLRDPQVVPIPENTIEFKHGVACRHLSSR